MWPRRFCLPGNEPQNWLPETWTDRPGFKRDKKRGRLEQLRVMQSQITQNRIAARRKAYIQIASLAVAYGTTIACGYLVLTDKAF
jgi:hypothetical protein